MTENEKIAIEIKARIAESNSDFITLTKGKGRKILEILNRLVPAEPERENSGSGMTWWNICGACKTAINPNDKYCHECGRAILWTGNGEKNNA